MFILLFASAIATFFTDSIIGSVQTRTHLLKKREISKYMRAFSLHQRFCLNFAIFFNLNWIMLCSVGIFLRSEVLHDLHCKHDELLLLLPLLGLVPCVTEPTIHNAVDMKHLVFASFAFSFSLKLLP